MPALTYAWPDHWSSPWGGIRCLVLGCEFATIGRSNLEQYTELLEHCEQQWGGGHEVLIGMLHQDICFHDGCSYRLDRPAFTTTGLVRALYDHETSTHNGATSMSQIEPFITLVRKGLVNLPDPKKVKIAIFERMVEHLGMMGNTTSLVFQRGGFFDPAHHTLENLRQVLSPRSLRPAGLQSPYWEPIPANLFLTNIAPRVDAPANDLWRIVWTRLRLMYAEGRL